jgi:hypothetical protein
MRRRTADKPTADLRQLLAKRRQIDNEILDVITEQEQQAARRGLLRGRQEASYFESGDVAIFDRLADSESVAWRVPPRSGPLYVVEYRDGLLMTVEARDAERRDASWSAASEIEIHLVDSRTKTETTLRIRSLDPAEPVNKIDLRLDDYWPRIRELSFVEHVGTDDSITEEEWPLIRYRSRKKRAYRPDTPERRKRLREAVDRYGFDAVRRDENLSRSYMYKLLSD